MATLGIPQNTIAVLQKYHFNFQKKFGQNFLIDTGVLDRIITAAEITKEDCVLEIGPGIGTMTQYLAERAGEVVAVEIDQNLIPILKETLAAYDNVTVIQDDILKVDVRKIVEEKNGGKTIKVVANLPYYITTPIIMGLFESHVPIDSITVMVQKEVADRMQVGPGTKDYGALSLAVQFYAKPEIVANVPPNCFMPRPNVGSAVIRLTRHEEVPVQVVCRQLSDLLEAKDYTGAQELFSTFGRGKELRATAPGPAAHAMSSLGLTALLGCSAYLGEEERRALWEQMIKCRSVDDYEAHFGQVLQQMERFDRKKAALLCKKEMAQIIQYIEENLSQHISLEMISETVHMTENYVSRLFKSESGMNVVGYINMEKMEQARRILSWPESTVRMAAGELGYYESSYFIKLFRKTYGIGPGEYKKFAEDRQAAPLLKTEE